jgi:hypothetical protein
MTTITLEKKLRVTDAECEEILATIRKTYLDEIEARAKDAVACFMETEERRQRGRHWSSEDRLCVKTGEMPAGGALVPASGEHMVVASEDGEARKQ